MIWRVIDRAFGMVAGLPHVAVCFLGCALIRAWLGIVLGDVRADTVVVASFELGERDVIRMGECIAFVLAPLCAGRKVPYQRNGGLLVLVVVLSLCGAAAMIGGYGLGGGPLLVGGLLATGGAYAGCLLLWLELYGCLSTSHALLAWSGSYLLNFAIWGVLRSAEHGLSDVCLVLFPLASVALAIASSRRLPTERLPAGTPSYRDAPWLLVCWIGMFGFFYGVGDALTGLAFSTLPARLGMACPAILALVCITLGLRCFDYRSLVIIAVCGMATGMFCVLVIGSDMLVSQVLMSAANESYLMLAYAFCCALSWRTGKSDVRACGLVGGMNIVAILMGTTAGRFLPDVLEARPELGLPLGVACVTIILVISLLTIYDRGYLDSLTLRDDPGDEVGERDLACADQWGLSPKETAVFQLLSQGMGTSEIAEELFLAPSTIRAHTSNIYKKMGIHSRPEFEEALARAARDGGTSG